MEHDQREHERLDRAITSLHNAVYGDENSVGMKKQIEEMYAVFVPVSLLGRILIKGILVLGALATAIVTLWKLFTHK